MATIITGGTGFLGAEVVRVLEERGDTDLFLFDIHPFTKRIDDLISRVEIIRGDLGEFSHVLDAVQNVRPQSIYHLGAMLSMPSEIDPSSAIRTNALGTHYVLEAARLFEVEQVLFSGTLWTYGSDVGGKTIDDQTLQRPTLFYGATKLFGEHMGLFYKRRYGLDFRGIRYPFIVGPGARIPGGVQYTCEVIEECAKGNPYTIRVRPGTRIPVIYIKDAARAITKLASAPLEQLKRANYVLAGVTPTPSAGELAEIVKSRLPEAKIEFELNKDLQDVLSKLQLKLDDSNARKEWNWQPEYDQEGIVKDFLLALNQHPERYNY